MENNEKLEAIIREISPETLKSFLRSKTSEFSMGSSHDLSEYIDEKFPDLQKVGELKFEDGEKALAIIIKVNDVLTERACRKAQYEKAKKILKDLHNYTAGIFVFCDNNKNFRFSLVYEQPLGARRTFNNFRRYTFYISPTSNNKTFRQQLKTASFNSFSGANGLREAFSINAVTDAFYNEFRPNFYAITGAVYKKSVKVPMESTRADLALLFVIRTIFLGFIQKREWIGDDANFIQNLWGEYKKAGFEGKDLFYINWLEPLFFESLSSPAGRVLPRDKYDFSKETQKKLQFAPYLNGGLFKRKPRLDDEGYHITDKVIGDFFEFLFSYNFTIEENTLYDEDLELNPEFLGIIFERLVNKENGAVYTPRTEVDLMCRLSLVKWLQANLSTTVNVKDLYELFFHEDGQGNGEEKDQKTDSFPQRELEEIISKLEHISVCDPAAGSGAFPVGMLHVLDGTLQHLHSKLKDKVQPTAFDRKKAIIFNSLYGVEVKEWAVWITQLRLWITLFIEAEESEKESPEAILPSLDFKIRAGDSLVQRIGSKAFPVAEHPGISVKLKAKITVLKNAKLDFFYNKRKDYENVKKLEISVFREILDDEISLRRAKIKEIKGEVPPEQPVLFIAEQQPLPLVSCEDEIERLRVEIQELEKHKIDIKEDHPLIWNIEFAEIFTDKGGFDILIGNPPYIRQEAIADPKGKIEKSIYKTLLMDMVKQDFPHQFGAKGHVNAQSDLYAYFYARGLRLLNSKGIHTFICENSWLDVDYGAWLQKLLLDNTPIHFIIDNHAKRSFTAVGVDTIISIIGAPHRRHSKSHSVRFVAFRKPFEEVISTENLLAIDSAEQIVSGDDFRVLPITTKNLLEAGKELIDGDQKNLGGGKYIGSKWGAKYIRTPDFLHSLCERGKFVPLASMCDLSYGNKPGIVDFFILNEETAKHFKIEKQFLQKIATSTGEIETLKINPKLVDKMFFTCPLSRAELKIQKLTGALDYISWGAKQITEKKGKHTREKIPWLEVPSVSGNFPEWHCFSLSTPGDFIVPLLIRERFFFAANPALLPETNMFFHGRFKKRALAELGSALINSTVTYFFLEIYGRHNIPGRFNIYGPELRPLPIPNPTLFSKEAQEEVLKKFEILAKRDVLKINEELIQKDRRDFDEVVFSALGLTKHEQELIYTEFLNSTDSRKSKETSV